MHFVNIMKIEEQRIEIAKFCGWTNVTVYADENQIDGFMPAPNTRFWQVVPNYTDDLNAIHEAEKKIINTSTWDGYYRWLVCVMDEDSESDNGCQSNIMIHASASQRCEALLRTIGKWKNE